MKSLNNIECFGWHWNCTWSQFATGTVASPVRSTKCRNQSWFKQHWYQLGTWWQNILYHTGLYFQGVQRICCPTENAQIWCVLDSYSPPWPRVDKTFLQKQLESFSDTTVFIAENFEPTCNSWTIYKFKIEI